VVAAAAAVVVVVVVVVLVNNAQQQTFNIRANTTVCPYSRTATCFGLKRQSSGYQYHVLKDKLKMQYLFIYHKQFFYCVDPTSLQFCSFGS
jgi:hypothetical protein